MTRRRWASGPIAALLAVGISAAIAYAYSPAPPPTPSDPLEPSVARSRLLSGTTPTGAAWVITGGLDSAGSLCADLQISTSDAFFGGCGLEIEPVVKTTSTPLCLLSLGCSTLTGTTVTPSNSLILFPDHQIKPVVGVDPAKALAFAFGTVSTDIAHVEVCSPGCVTYRVVDTPTGRWFGGVVSGLESQSTAVITAVTTVGGVVDAFLYDMTPREVDSCRNTDPETFKYDPRPVTKCIPPLTRNQSIASSSLPVRTAARMIDIPVASFTPGTTVTAELTGADGQVLAAGAGRFEEDGAGVLRVPLTRAGLALVDTVGRTPAALNLSFARGDEQVDRSQKLELDVVPGTSG